MTEGRVTDRFLKIRSGSLIQFPKNGVFRLFRVFLAKIFLAAPSAPQKFRKKANFCPKVGHLSNFSAPSAPKNGSLIDLGHPPFRSVTPPNRALMSLL